MANNNILLLVLVLAVVFIVLAYYFVFANGTGGGCKWCPKCGGKTTPAGTCPSCPTCAITNTDALKVLQQLARSCTQRLRGVVREDMASADDVGSFMTGGANRLVILSNVVPEEFVQLVNIEKAMENLKVVAMSSSIIRGKKNYIVMSVIDGQLGPIGVPTPSFAEAFKYMESTARKEIGHDVNTLVFYVDEDIPCMEETTPIGEEIVGIPPVSPRTENCCGRRF